MQFDLEYFFLWYSLQKVKHYGRFSLEMETYNMQIKKCKILVEFSLIVFEVENNIKFNSRQKVTKAEMFYAKFQYKSRNVIVFKKINSF